MINKPESKSKVSNSVSQSKYNTLLKEYNALVDEAYEETDINISLQYLGYIRCIKFIYFKETMDDNFKLQNKIK